LNPRFVNFARSESFLVLGGRVCFESPEPQDKLFAVQFHPVSRKKAQEMWLTQFEGTKHTNEFGAGVSNSVGLPCKLLWGCHIRRASDAFWCDWVLLKALQFMPSFIVPFELIL